MATTRHENYVSPVASSGSVVSISRVMPVYPNLVQSERVLKLSNLDRQCPSLMYLVLFYNTCHMHEHGHGHEDLSLNSVVSRLKSGLEETLSLWYPAAGRLRASQGDGKLNLWCNNEGAIVVEAHTSLSISQLGDLSHYNPFFENLVYKPSFHPNFSNMPLLVAQVTKFGCGGYSIGIGTSHSLFDGPATYEFLRAWACNSEMVKGGRKRGGEVAITKPVHERGILLSRNHELAPKETTNYNICMGIMASNSSSNLNQQHTKAVAIDHLYQLIMQAAAATEQKGFGHSHSQPQQNDCVLKTYPVSAAFIHYLKTKHFSINTDSPPLSTFELLASHLWKARTKALGVRKEKKVCLQFAVDTRKKMMGAIPKGFSGNAYVLASVMMSAGELEKASYEGIVERIREAKKGVNHGYVKSYVEALESGAQASLPPLKELTLVSDWTRMPFHDVPFFHAKAVYASPLASPIPQVAYFMHSPSHTSALDVRIGLHPHTLTAFTHYFLSKPR